MKYITFLLLLLFAASCQDDDSEPPQLNGVGPISPDLVGSWNGTISGDFGTATLSCMLTNTGALDCTIPTGSPYCKVTGEWGVINDLFNTRGEEECEETELNFAAPGNSVTMSGNWIDGNGNEGTFVLDKL